MRKNEKNRQADSFEVPLHFSSHSRRDADPHLASAGVLQIPFCGALPPLAPSCVARIPLHSGTKGSKRYQNY